MDVRIDTNQTIYYPGDQFLCVVLIENAGDPVYVDEYIVLELLGEYYCYPSWSSTQVDRVNNLLISSGETVQQILNFQWPAGIGIIDNIVLYAALTNPISDPFPNPADIRVYTWKSCKFFGRTSNVNANKSTSYVVDDGEGNDQTGDGSCGAPWETIQHAIAQLPQSGSQQLTVFVNPGDYSISATSKLVIPQNVSIVGVDFPSAVLIGDDSAELIVLGDNACIMNFTLQGCSIVSEDATTITGNIFTEADSLTENIPLITVSTIGQAPDQVILNNLFFDNNVDDIIRCEGTAAPLIMNCTLAANSGNGTVCSDSSAPAIKNTIVTSNSAAGIKVTGSAAPVIEAGDVWNNGNEYSGITDQTGDDGNISLDPKFVSGPYHNYYLAHDAAGQATDSPCVNGVDESNFPPYPPFGTTRNDGVPDRGRFDIGYHMLKVSSIVGYGDITGDTFSENILRYIGSRAPAEAVGVDDDGRLIVFDNDGSEDGWELSDQTFPTGTRDAIFARISNHHLRYDIVAAYSDEIILYSHEGDGIFAVKQSISSNDEVFDMEVTHLNNDTWLDLLAGTNDGIEIYLNDRYGMLVHDLHIDGDDIEFLASGDFDGDDDVDFAAASPDGVTQLYLNDGTGDFEEGQLIETESVSALALEYVNGDTVLDLVITVDECTTEVSYGDNRGGFKQFTFIVPWFTTDVYYNQYWDTKVVVKNAGGFDGHAVFTYYDQSGHELAGTKETLTVASHGVMVRDLNAVAADTFGSIEITAVYATTGVVLYTYHNANDTDHALYSVALQSTEELAANPQAPWYLSTTWSSDYSFGTIDSLSSLYLKNPSDQTVELTITYYYPDGTTADVDSSIEIDPHGVYAASMYWGMPSDAGSCEVEADGPLLGLTSRCYTNTTTGEKFMHAENLQHTEFAGSTMTTPYYLSYVDEDWYWESWFSVKNPWDN